MDIKMVFKVISIRILMNRNKALNLKRLKMKIHLIVAVCPE